MSCLISVKNIRENCQFSSSTGFVRDLVRQNPLWFSNQLTATVLDVPNGSIFIYNIKKVKVQPSAPVFGQLPVCCMFVLCGLIMRI